MLPKWETQQVWRLTEGGNPDRIYFKTPLMFMYDAYFECILILVVFCDELLCLPISQLECESFFPNSVCTKYFCSILLSHFISSRDDTSHFVFNRFSRNSRWMFLHEDGDIRCV